MHVYRQAVRRFVCRRGRERRPDAERRGRARSESGHSVTVSEGNVIKAHLLMGVLTVSDVV